MFNTNKIRLEDCLKYAGAYFEASKSGHDNSVGGGLVSVLPDRLKTNMEIDKINLKFELMHPRTRALTDDGFIYPASDLPVMPQNIIDGFTKIMRSAFEGNDAPRSKLTGYLFNLK